jgi:hypothetical protein
MELYTENPKQQDGILRVLEAIGPEAAVAAPVLITYLDEHGVTARVVSVFAAIDSKLEKEVYFRLLPVLDNYISGNHLHITKLLT